MRRAIDNGHTGAEAAAKNCITVGASQSSQDPMNLNPDAVADFNSRGPIKNRRHKPDVVAPGTCILSANSGMVQTPANLGPDNHWCYKEGTSMAAPLVAGYAACPSQSPHQPLSHMSTTIPKHRANQSATHQWRRHFGAYRFHLYAQQQVSTWPRQ